MTRLQTKHVTHGRRLRVEELETRDMLAVVPFPSIPLPATNPQGSGAINGGGFPVNISATSIVANGGFGAVLTGGFGVVSSGNFGPITGFTVGAAAGVPGTPGYFANTTNANPGLGATATSIDYSSGVGQMTITTGSGTLGISSFAMPIAGFSSQIGGTSGG